MASSFRCEERKIGDLQGYVWHPVGEVRSVCVIFHGYAAHGKYGTIVFAAELLAASATAVVACDFRGFGKSPGQAGLIESLESLLGDAEATVAFARAEFPEVPVFALGSSMGGNVALHASLRFNFRGVVLLGPMIETSARPPWWQVPLLKAVNCVPYARTAGLLSPSGLASDKQYKDPERRKICDDDELGYHGSMCLATAAALLEAISALQEKLHELTVPMLIIHGDADEIVPLSGSKLLLDKAKSQDKTLSVYPGMLHSPLCEFPDVRQKVEKEILDWIATRLVLP